MQNVYVVTHAQSVHHIEDLGGGWYDTSLTEKGIEQAGKLAEYLYDEIGKQGISIYSSDLKRAFETLLLGIDGFISRVPGIRAQSWGVMVKARRDR